MAISQSFLSFLKDELAPLGAITMRNMFGGAAAYCDGQLFALVNDDVLYFKVDDQTRLAFEAEGSSPFGYSTKDGAHHLTSYWRAPERLFDDTDELRTWTKTAVAVGHHASAQKSAPKARIKKALSKPRNR
jgi:DNA transformation protein and related proteins